VDIVGCMNLTIVVGNFVGPAILGGNRNDFRNRETGAVVPGTETDNFGKAVCYMNYCLWDDILETRLCIHTIFRFAGVADLIAAAFGAVVVDNLGSADPYWECFLCMVVYFVGTAN
jgi:hypothetical protein